MLTISLQEPSHVVIRTDRNVPRELGNALSRNIAPGRTTREDDSITVPLERFLATRNWLAQTLETYECDIEFSDDIAELIARSDSERREVARLLSSKPMPVEDLDSRLKATRFKRELKSFQRRDLADVLALSNGANFSVPGAGKTTVELACYELHKHAGLIERALVVAPLSAFEAWFKEADECLTPTPKVHRFDGSRIPLETEILLINYQRLAANYSEIAEWVAECPCLVVLDEAHRMKRGRNGEWGSACLDLAHLASRRDILTGTPAPQHPTDLVALLEFLWPHQSGVILPSSARDNNPDAATMAMLSTRLDALFVRTRKDELGLRDPCMKVELVEMKPVQQEIYDGLRTRMRRALASGPRERASLAHLGEVFVYLLQAATNPALLARGLAQQGPSALQWPPLPAPTGSPMAQLILNYGSHEMPAKFEKLAALIDINVREKRKTLVWSNFVGTLHQLAEKVLRPYQPALVYGGVPAVSEDELVTTRETELDRFRSDEDCWVLLANPAAMSEGVSLHDVCHDAIYVDRTFNAGQYLQSVDRIHRLGLKRGVDTRVTFLVTRETIDESVDDRVRLKAERLAEMLSDRNLVTMALPDEDAYGEWVDVGDVDLLFAHLQE